MEIKTVYDMIDRFECSDLIELEVELQGARMHMKRESGTPCPCGNRGDLPGTHKASWGSEADMAVADTAIETVAGTASENAADTTSDHAAGTASEIAAGYGPEPALQGLKEVKAPLVGTFYSAASPDTEPFVSVGQEVKKGDVIGIIEAMKLMNEVTASESGVVASIEAVNGELVEFGQVLLRLRG